MNAKLKRRNFIMLLGGAAATWPLAARTQQQPDRVRLIGLLSVGAGDTAAQPSAFRDALAKLGWVEGRNLHIELRFGGDSDADIRRYAAELVNLAPDVIVTRGGFATLAMQQLTRTIPIVTTGAGDPIAAGLIKDMAHPEGNITGVTNRVASVNGKLLELLKEAAPGVRRVAILQPDEGNAASFVAQIDGAARALALQAVHIPYRNAVDIVRGIFRGGAGRWLDGSCTSAADLRESTGDAPIGLPVPLADGEPIQGVCRRRLADQLWQRSCRTGPARRTLFASCAEPR